MEKLRAAVAGGADAAELANEEQQQQRSGRAARGRVDDATAAALRRQYAEFYDVYGYD